jgi:hypothetical protein
VGSPSHYSDTDPSNVTRIDRPSQLPEADDEALREDRDRIIDFNGTPEAVRESIIAIAAYAAAESHKNLAKAVRWYSIVDPPAAEHYGPLIRDAAELADKLARLRSIFAE